MAPEQGSEARDIKKILLVDDDQEIVESMRIALEATGYDVLIIEGKADKPYYAFVQDGNVELRDASGVDAVDGIFAHSRRLPHRPNVMECRPRSITSSSGA